MSFSFIEARAWLKDYIEKEAETLLVSLRLYTMRAGLATQATASEIAQDLLNDVVIEALKHADRLDSIKVSKAWLLGIASNLIKRRQSALSKQNHREPLVRDMLPDSVMSDDDLFDQLAMHSVVDPAQEYESNEFIKSVLSSVSESDREIVQLAIFYEMNGVMIAKELNISPEAARMRLHRALKRLRKAYSTELNNYGK